MWILTGVAAALCLLVYGWAEAGWLRTRTMEVAIPDLPESLDGLRIAHLSDFHLGARGSLGSGASERASAWAADQGADLVCITGDLISHPRGVPRLTRLLARFERPLIVYGNHDVAHTRDPFSRAATPADVGGTFLRGEAVLIEARDVSIQVVGVDPSEYAHGTAHPARLVDERVQFRLLLCHFPGILRRLPAGAFHFVLSGHMHGGQIVLPFPWKRLMLAHPLSPYTTGIYRFGATVMHVSQGTGTSFLPFRFLARPEATLLILRSSSLPRSDAVEGPGRSC